MIAAPENVASDAGYPKGRRATIAAMTTTSTMTTAAAVMYIRLRRRRLRPLERFRTPKS